MGAHRTWCPSGYELFTTECSKGMFNTTYCLFCHRGIFITKAFDSCDRMVVGVQIHKRSYVRYTNRYILNVEFVRRPPLFFTDIMTRKTGCQAIVHVPVHGRECSYTVVPWSLDYVVLHNVTLCLYDVYSRIVSHLL